MKTSIHLFRPVLAGIVITLFCEFAQATQLTVGTPLEIVVESKPTVAIEFSTEVGKYYQVQYSTDLIAWDNEGYSVKGTGGRIFLQVSGRDKPKAFFRVRNDGNPANIAPSVPNGLMVGTLAAYAGGAIPDGWLLCNGQAVDSATYPELYAAIGEIWGTGGDGSGGKFNLPDLRGRTTLGAGAGSDLTSRSIGQSGGEEKHTLTIAELPPHGHATRYSTQQGSNTTGPYVAGYVFAAQAVRAMRSDSYDVTDTTSSSSTGGGTAFNVLPPYGVVYWLIKY